MAHFIIDLMGDADDIIVNTPREIIDDELSRVPPVWLPEPDLQVVPVVPVQTDHD